MRYFIAIGLAFASPALAQEDIPTGSRMRAPRPVTLDSADVRKQAEYARFVMQAFAACVVKRDQAKVEQALSLPLDLASSAIKRLSTSDCLSNGSISFSTLRTRGAFFAALYALKFRAGSSLPTTVPDFGKFDDKQHELMNAYIAMMYFSDCVARADFENSRRFLQEKVGSKAEDAAFDALRPKLGPCLDQGQNIKFTKETIENGLAEVLYREGVMASTSADNH